MDHPPAHRDRVLEHLLRKSDLLERMNAARGKREIDRTTANEVPGARIGPTFVKLYLVTASAEICSEQTARQAAPDKDEFRHRRISRLDLEEGGKFVAVNPEKKE